MLMQEEEQCRKEQTEQECVNNRLRFRLSDERNIQLLLLLIRIRTKCYLLNDFESVIRETSRGSSTLKETHEANRLKEM